MPDHRCHPSSRASEAAKHCVDRACGFKLQTYSRANERFSVMGLRPFERTNCRSFLSSLLHRGMLSTTTCTSDSFTGRLHVQAVHFGILLVGWPRMILPIDGECAADDVRHRRVGASSHQDASNTSHLLQRKHEESSESSTIFGR